MESEWGIPLRGGRGLGKSRANLGIKSTNEEMKVREVKELPTVTAWPNRGLNPGDPATGFALLTSLLMVFWSVLLGLRDALGYGRQKEGGGRWAGAGESRDRPGARCGRAHICWLLCWLCRNVP